VASNLSKPELTPDQILLIRGQCRGLQGRIGDSKHFRPAQLATLRCAPQFALRKEVKTSQLNVAIVIEKSIAVRIESARRIPKWR